MAKPGWPRTAIIARSLRHFSRFPHWKAADEVFGTHTASPQLNGKVERSHRTDQQEFYQLLTYTDDVDLHKRLAEWENFYNLSRPHGAFNGKAPYETRRERL